MKQVSIGLVIALPVSLLVINTLASAGAYLSPRVSPAPAAIQLEPVLTGLSVPVFAGNARDGSNRLFVVEQSGGIKVLQSGATSPTVFLNLTSLVMFGGEQGLLGLAFHPYYRNNGRFFVNYTRKPDGATVVAEYHVSSSNPNVADTTEIPILTITQPFTNHNGGMLSFGPDGYLYINMGDGGSANDPNNRAQNVNELLGKILRIDIDHSNGSVPYTSPPTNPFFGSSIPGRDEIYAIGMRNPWRSSFDRATGQLYVGDVGQGAREEVDIVTLGGNYGWRVMEGSICNPSFNGGVCTPPSGSILPITEYSHTGGRCSITGGYVYRGHISTLPAGAYIFADYCTGEIFMFSGGDQSLLLDTALNISSFGEDETDELYVVGLGGTVDRIVNPAGTCSSFINPATESFSSSGGAGNVAIAMPVSCSWAAISNDQWISITSADASGSGAVNYLVGSNSAGTPRTGTLSVAGKTFTAIQGESFADVTSNNQFFDHIGRLSANQITGGCGVNAQGGRLYCPSSSVTREQMAAFIIRALGEPNPTPPATQRFVDVPPTNQFYAFIDRLAALGITVGCSVNAQGEQFYCPSESITREQMAAFIIRALGETNPTPPGTGRFADVPPSNPFYAFIDRMAVRGVTSGCGTNGQGQLIYCPSSIVTREQMAAFLARAFNL